MADENNPTVPAPATGVPLIRVRNSSKHIRLRKRRGKSSKKFRLPKTPWGQFLFFFFIELVSCGILVAATRAEAQANFLWTTITSLLWETQVFITWLMMYEDRNARTWFSGAGMILGSTVGADLALLITKHLYGA